jgi:hypothetical protein
MFNSQKMTKKKILYICIPIVIIATIVLLLVSSARLRHNVFRVSIELPGTLSYFKIRSAAINRDFKSCSVILMRQLSFVKSFSDSKNSMLTSLLANTHYVMRQTRLQDDAEKLLPYLESLAAYQGDIFNVHIWLAEALLTTDPKKALKHARTAQKILQSDDRSYRIAIEAALNLNQAELIEEECAKYRVANHGQYHDHQEYDMLFEGVGIRKMAIELKDDQGNTKLVTKERLIIAKNITHSFILNNPILFQNLRLHLALMPGISIDISEVRMFREGLLVNKFGKEEISISARYGFFQNGALKTVSRKGDLLILRFPNNIRVNTDRVDIKMTLKRLSPVLNKLC